MTRRRLIQILTLVVVTGLVLRLTGVIHIPDRLLLGAIALDVLLGLIEAALFIYLARPVYRRHRQSRERFDAFIETLREVEPIPKPVFALMERELRAYRAAYLRIRRVGRRRRPAARSAIVIAVPAAAASVDDWRRRHTWDGKRGVPGHVTLLFPFIPRDELDETTLAELAALFAAEPSFEFALVRAARFPGVLYLAPEPAEPFVRLTERLVAAYPAYPPYEGAFKTVVPHLTVAEGDEALLDRIERELAGRLPIAASARAATLLVEGQDGHWTERRRFALAAR